MPVIKKIIFAPIFLGLVAAVIYFYQPILNQYLDIFFSSYGGLYEFGILAIIIAFTSLSFCLYLTFTQDIKFAAPIALTASAIPFIFLKPQLALIIGIGLLLSLAITYFTLQVSLKSYVNFQPGNLLSGPVKTLNTFIVLVLAFGFFLNANSIIKTQGFKIPDALIDWAVNLSLNQAGIPVLGEKYLAQLPNLTREQIDLLKQNPQVLEQYGINSSDLDQFIQGEAPKTTTQPNRGKTNIIPSVPGVNFKETIKSQISNSLDSLIKPYLFAIPAILAFLFYSLASFCLWITGIFISPAIQFIFYLLEKSGFIKFEKEMREVKKIIV